MRRAERGMRRAACLALLPGLCAAIPSGPRIYGPKLNDSADEAADKALCFADVFQGTLALARGVYSSYESAIYCGNHGGLGDVVGGARRLAGEVADEDEIQKKIDHLQEEFDRKQNGRCRVTVSEVVSTMAESASYLASSASDCVDYVQEGAYCAADISALIGALAQVVNMASSVNGTCGGTATRLDLAANGAARRLQGQSLATPTATPGTVYKQRARRRQAGQNRSARRLSVKSKNFFDAWRKEVEEERLQKAIDRFEKFEEREHRLRVTACVLDVNQAMAALLRAGLAVNQAVDKCKAGLLKTDVGRRICAVDLSGAIGSFTFAAEYLSSAASHCDASRKGREENEKAECVSDIMQLITSLSCLTAVGAAMPLSCSDEVKDFDEGIPAGRRLAAGAPALLV